MSGQYAEQQKGDMKHLSAVPSPVSANATASGAPLYLCRASGDGSHSFRICADEAGVFAFYEEMFGKPHDGTIDSEIEHFRDPDNWAYEGTAYEVELYCAKWEVWKAEPQELRSPEAASALTTLTQDAKRYQYLRDQPNDDLWQLLTELNEGPLDGDTPSSSEAWDAAIDAAMEGKADE